jgi:hypothetical protein
MTPDARWDRFTHTKAGRFVSHPLFIVGMAIFMVVNAVVAGWALTTSWEARDREIVVARAEAAKAVAQANQANRSAIASRAASSEAARQAFCRIIILNVGNNPPPTTARGFALQAAYAEFGKSPVLHCFSK